MDTRQRLLQVTSSLLKQNGPKLSTRAVCKAAGVTAPTLYHHFGDKQGLIDATVADAFEKYIANKKDLVPTGNLMEDLRHGWDLHVDFGRSNPVLYMLMFPSVNGSELPEAAYTAYTMLKHGMEEAERTGQLNPSITADLAVRALWSALYGTTKLICSDTEQRDADLLSAFVREAVIRAIVRPATGDNKRACY